MALSWRAVALLGAGVVPTLLWPAPGTALIWLAFTLALCAADLALAAPPGQIGLRREVPRSLRLGEPTRSQLMVVNATRRRLRATVRDAWPPSTVWESAAAQNHLTVRSARHRVDLPPGESARVTTPLQPTRRGDAQAGPVTVRSFGPLGLAARQTSVAVPARLRVLPEFASRRFLPSRLARLRELDGRAAVRVRGEGTEFDSLREYVPGDDVRSIDWRATARREEVVVRTWRPERDRRVVIVLDTGRTSAARVDGVPRLDGALETALLLAALVDRAGDRVQVLAFDRAVRARVTGASGPRLLPELAESLANLTPHLVETDWAALIAQVRGLASQRAFVVLLTALEPSALETGLLPVIGQLTGTHQVLIAAVADPNPLLLAPGGEQRPVDVFDRAAAARAELERQAAASLLRRTGAEVVEAEPGRLPAVVADAYLALKAARRL